MGNVTQGAYPAPNQPEPTKAPKGSKVEPEADAPAE
jgi:hypothetical protein